MAAAMTSDGGPPAALLRQIQAKLGTGQLPSAVPEKTGFGPGTRRPCCGCEQPIPATEHEVVDFAQHPTLRFHAPCFRAWRRAPEGSHGTAAPPGPP
jgi:hypothetical protein